MPRGTLQVPKNNNRKTRAKLNTSNITKSHSKKRFKPIAKSQSLSTNDELGEAAAEEEKSISPDTLDGVHAEVQGLDLSSLHQASSSQSHARRRQNEDESYKQYREDYKTIMGTQSYRDLLDVKAKAVRAAYQHMIAEQSAKACCCKRCGQSASLCGEPVKLVPVKLIALYHTIDLLVPIYQCTRSASSRCQALRKARAGRMRIQPPYYTVSHCKLLFWSAKAHAQYHHQLIGALMLAFLDISSSTFIPPW